MNELDTSREGQPEPVDQRVRREHDRGSTLVELLISIVLIGMVVVSVLAAAFTSISASSTVFEAAQVETVLLNAGDRVVRAPQLCDYEDYVDAAALAEGWPLSSTSVVVESLVANTGNPSDWTPPSCPDDVRPFDVQRLTITASTPSGEITRTLTVVKSNVE